MHLTYLRRHKEFLKIIKLYNVNIHAYTRIYKKVSVKLQMYTTEN